MILVSEALLHEVKRASWCTYQVKDGRAVVLVTSADDKLFVGGSGECRHLERQEERNRVNVLSGSEEASHMQCSTRSEVVRGGARWRRSHV